MTPPFVALTVTEAPASTPGTSTNGVESAVTSSVEDVPVSDDDERSGLTGRTGAVASTVRFMDGPAADVLPAGSVRVPDTDHVPSVRAGRSQDVAAPTTYEQVRVVDPFVAVNVAVSPAVPPGTETAGVVSDVASSVDEVPVSEAGRRSAAPGAAGAVASTARLVVPVVAPVFPAASVTDADRVHVPSVNAGRSQAVEEPTVYVQVFVVEPFVADIVTWSPLESPGTETAGVVSLVRLSVEDDPVSEAASTSGVPGAG